MAPSILSLLAYSLCYSFQAYAQANVTSISDDFSWTSITPSPRLQYHDCGGGYQCARLELPLDWNATRNDSWYQERYNMAIVKIPAQVPVSDPRYGGPVLINPGGPGGSGSDYALQAGQYLQRAFDAAYSYNSTSYVSKNPNARYFDIIGFDTRGVGKSTPFYECILDIPYSNQVSLTINRLGLTYPKDNLDQLWSLYSAVSRSCIWDPARGPSGSHIANFSSSASVARDLVEFAERHGEWRQAQGGAVWKKGEEPILYYGVSYGTLLGALLAAMQPHRVWRFVLDGVVQAQEYFNGLYTTDASQGNEAVERFFEYCALAGPKNCSFWNGNSARDTERRLQAIYDDIKANGSIIVPGTKDVQATALSLADVEGYFSEMVLYASYTGFPAAADALAPLTHRNGTELALAIQTKVDWRHLGSQYNVSDPATQDGAAGTFWSAAIEGADVIRRRTQQQYVDEVFTPLQNISSWTADFTATEFLSDSLWPVMAKWRFGDIHSVASNITAKPILFQSNLIDGVTSLPSAKFMQAAFKGSALLLSNGEGHTTGAEVSLCLAQGTRYYFQTGKLPDTSKVCEVVRRPFLGVNGPGVAKLGHLNKEDQYLLDTQELITANY